MKTEKRISIIAVAFLLSLVLSALRTVPIRAQIVDMSIKAVIVYPPIDSLPEINTPMHLVWFGVGILNEGTVDTYCNVTIYLNMSVKFFVPNFFVQANTFGVVVRKNTTSEIGKGAYATSALVEAAGDIDPSDNYMTGDIAKVGMIADTNFDHKVDMRDVAAVSSRYGMTNASLDPVWTPEVDVNADGKIDLKDLGYYAKLLDFYNMTRCCVGWLSYGPHGTPEWSWACDLYRDGKIDIRDLAIVSKHFGEVDP